MKNQPKAFGIYRHFKGKYYQVITVAEHTETGDKFVIYMPLYGEKKTYARPLDMFMSEVNHKLYPKATQKYRFEEVDFDQKAKQTDEPTKPSDTVETKEATDKSIGKSIEDTVKGDYLVESTLEDFDEEDAVDEGLMQFLDADSYEKKLEILVSLRNRLDESMLNTMAVSLDLEVKEGSIEQQYEDIKYCLTTLERYECNRLR